MLISSLFLIYSYFNIVFYNKNQPNYSKKMRKNKFLS